jgi:hypothetical protein
MWSRTTKQAGRSSTDQGGGMRKEVSEIGWGGSVNATVSIATLTTPFVKAHTVSDP